MKKPFCTIEQAKALLRRPMAGWESDPVISRLEGEIGRLTARIPRTNQFNVQLRYVQRVRRLVEQRNERWAELQKGGESEPRPLTPAPVSDEISGNR